MIVRETLLEILQDGCRAPSGDNSQPWRFVVDDRAIFIHNRGDEDHSIFNYRQRGNLLSIGACIENLRVSAQAHGYHPDLTLFPEPTDRSVVARVTLTPFASNSDRLAAALATRATNRKRYLPKKIEVEKLAELAALGTETLRIVFVTNAPDIAELARIVSAGERLVLEDRSIHDHLFGHITWTAEEDRERHGFFIDTFEFAPPQRAMFRLLRHWRVLKLLLSLGIANLIVRDVTSIHATAAAFGAILIPNRSGEAYVQTGMLLERLWLTATALGLSLQPTTGVQLAGTCLLEGYAGSLSGAQQHLIRSRYAALAEQFGTRDGETLGFIFRMGYADAPSGRTTRFEPDMH